MKFLILISVVLIIISCKPSKHINVSENLDTVISKSELSSIIDSLSSDYFEGRETGSLGIDKAAKYLENLLIDYKIKPFYKNYRDSFIVYETKAFNLVGLIDGSDSTLKNEYIIISAHYDHIGKERGGRDSVFNGANDNCTGVSTVLNIAKILASYKPNKRSVIVALFSGEELGLLGSEYLAEKLKKAGLNVYCAINIDMIGSVLTNESEKVYLSGYKKSNMAQVFNKYLGSEAIVYWKKEELYGLFTLSDNYPIYEKLKIPAHTFCTFDFSNYAHYHKLTDEITNINIDNTLKIAQNICRAVIKVSESSEKEIKLTN